MLLITICISFQTHSVNYSYIWTQKKRILMVYSLPVTFLVNISWYSYSGINIMIVLYIQMMHKNIVLVGNDSIRICVYHQGYTNKFFILQAINDNQFKDTSAEFSAFINWSLILITLKTSVWQFACFTLCALISVNIHRIFEINIRYLGTL